MSTVTDISSSSIKTQTKNNKSKLEPKKVKDHTETPTSSISEDLFEDKIVTSLILNNEATENYTSKFIKNSFDSENTTISASRSTPFKDNRAKLKKKSKRNDSFDSSCWSHSSSLSSSLSFTEQYSSFKSKEASSSKNKYTQDFESLSDESSLNTELEEFLNMTKFKRQQLKNQDNISYFTNKIKAEQKRLKAIKRYGQSQLNSYLANKKQVDKLIERVENFNPNIADSQPLKKSTFDTNKKLIKSDIINRLDAVNSVARVKHEQEEKIQRFGDELNDSISEQKVDKRAQNIYYKMKINQMSSKLTNENFSKHEVFYCDSLMLIGNLAAYLPKHSDPREEIWEKLTAPLNQNEYIEITRKT